MLRTKNFKTVLASMLVVCATAFYSCDSDGEGPGDEGTTSESAIIGKWEVSGGGNTRAGGTTEYGSFEFTADNKYIITQPTTTTSGEKALLVIFGDYVTGSSKDNELTLDLKEFGVITIAVNKTSATITVNGVTYVAVKAKEVDASDNAKKLIGTWKVKSKYEDEPEFTDDGTITFTNSGTYLGMFIDGDTGELRPDNGTWSWKPNNIISLSYESYWATIGPGYIDPETGEYTPGKTESGVEQGFDDWKIIKLTDKEFTFEIDDEGDIITMIGTK